MAQPNTEGIRKGRLLNYLTLCEKLNDQTLEP
jgi:hypothetical protein